MTEVALGLLVNPKLARPVLASWDGKEVDISVLEDEWEVIGSGYYGDSDDAAASATGYPRSHTPSGVTIKKQGYGTCLYTALCLGAHLNSTGALKIFRYGPDGDGICSETDGRSSAADEWWSRAKDLGIAKEIDESTTEEHVDVTSDFADTVQGGDVHGKVVTYVNTIDVDLESSLTVDVYPYSKAERHNLVLAAFGRPVEMTHPEALWQVVRADKELEIEFPQVLPGPAPFLALDVRGISVAAMNLIGTLAEVAGATEDELHDLRFRWEAGIDPSVPVRRQMRLPFKKNSHEARRAEELIRLTARYRQDAGWAELSDLP